MHTLSLSLSHMRDTHFSSSFSLIHFTDSFVCICPKLFVLNSFVRCRAADD